VKHCFFHQISARVILATYKYLLLLAGYRIVNAKESWQRDAAYKIRKQVYVKSGYLNPRIKTNQFKDIFDQESVVWLSLWHSEPVGTLRATPLRDYNATIFVYVEDAKNQLYPFIENSAEIGRFAIIQEHRGGILSMSLLITSYVWALREGYEFLIWGGPHSIYYWLTEFIPGTQFYPAKAQHTMYKELGGYLRKHQEIGFYIVPLCKVRLANLIRYMFSKWSLFRATSKKH